MYPQEPGPGRPADSSPAVENALTHLRGNLSRLTAITNSLAVVVSRVAGWPPKPEPTGQDTVKPRRSGLVGCFEDISDDINEELTRLDSLIIELATHV